MDAHPVNIYEYEEIAKGKIGQGEYDFIAGGATDEITLRRTRAVFDAIMLRPRMMVDISQRDLSTTVLGQNIRFPIMLDPAGNHGAAHPEGELASVRAAGAAGTILVLSAQSSRTLEEMAQAATGPIWFQQYFFKERGLTLEMARRAEAAGYSALCLTLDAKATPPRMRLWPPDGETAETVREWFGPNVETMRDLLRRAAAAHKAARARADFDHGSVFQRTGGAGDAARQVEVEQEVLAERFLGHEPMGANDLAQGRQVVDLAHGWPALAPRRAASLIAAIRLSGRAMPFPAMSKAVP